MSGAALVLISGVVAFGAFSSLSNRVEVLATARPIAEGQVVEKADFQVVSLPADSGVNAVSLDTYLTDPTVLIGKTARGPISEGVLIDPAQLADGTTADQPMVIVGAALQPGQYPVVGLNAGDRVSILEISGPRQNGDESQGGPRELSEGLVVEVSPLGQSGENVFVSIEINEAVATSVAERIGEGRVRLALVDYQPGSVDGDDQGGDR